MHRWISWGFLLIFLVAATSNGLLLGLGHDEGVSVDISVGAIDHELLPSFEPMPVAELYRSIDGSRPRSPGQVLDQLLRRVNPYPPAYFLLLHFWTQLNGVHRLTLRLPSLISGVLTLIGMALLMRRLTTRASAAFWVVLLTSISPWFTGIATFARPYAFTMALGVWSTICVVDLANGHAVPWRRIQFVSLSLLGIYSLYHYGFVIAWQFCFLTVASWRQHPQRRASQLAIVAAMGVIITIGFLPWLPPLLRHFELTGNTPSYYKGAVNANAVVGSTKLISTFLFGDALPPTARVIFDTILTWFGALTLLSLAVTLARTLKARTGDITAQTLVWTAPFYPGAILVADLIHGTRTITITKTCFLLFPMLIVGIVHAWSQLGNPQIRRGALILWAIVLTGASVTTAHARTLWVDHHVAVAKALAASDSDGHHVLLNSMIRGHAIPLLLTLQESGIENVQIVFAPPLQLEDTLRRTLRSKDTKRVTLINLHALYAWDDTQLWSREQIEASARMARRARWDVKRSPPDVITRRIEPTDVKRRFEIINPVW